MRRELDALRRKLEKKRAWLLEQDSTAASVNAIEADLRAVDRVALLLTNEQPKVKPHPRLNRLKPDSRMALVIDILHVAERELHVNEIVRVAKGLFRQKFTKNDISSRMAKLARDERIFRKVGPNTYSLYNPSQWSGSALMFSKADIWGLLGICEINEPADDSGPLISEQFRSDNVPSTYTGHGIGSPRTRGPQDDWDDNPDDFEDGPIGSRYPEDLDES